MIKLPDFSKPFEYENNFNLTSDITRIGKILAHYELFKKSQGLAGAIVECGVFKGSSLIRFATYRSLFGNVFSKKIIGFDAFGKFPETSFEGDKKMRQKFIDDSGEEGIGEDQLMEVLKRKGISGNVELIEGNICETLPKYLEKNPGLKISLLNIDTDVYEPAKVILENLWDKIVLGGILILDDYGIWPGETKAVDEFFKGKNVKIEKLDFCTTPCFIIKK